MKHQQERKQRVATAHSLEFTNIQCHFMSRFPGATKKDVRDLVVARCRFIAVSFADSMALESEPLQTKNEQFFAEYVTQIELCAANPCMADVCAGTRLRTEAISYMNKLTEHMALSYLCRYPACGFFGMNSQWVRQLDREYFRCPICGLGYAPWSQANGQVLAQKVVTIVSPVDGTTMHIPCIWPDGAADSYLHKLIEAKAEESVNMTDFGNLVAEGSVAQVDAFARRVGIPSSFVRLEMPQECKWRLESTSIKFPASQYEHLVRNGIYGAMMDLSKPIVALSDFTEIVTLMGNSLAIGRHLAK